MIRCDDVVGAMFRAEVYCPTCTIEVYREARREAGAVIDSVEWAGRYTFSEILEEYAAWRGIDFEDEFSYDSDDFPKVVFREAVDGYAPEPCGRCGRFLQSVV